MSPAEGPEGLIAYRGREGLVRWLQEISEAWQDVRYELLEFEQEGSRVLAIVRLRMRGRATKLRLDTRSHLFTLGENDKVVRMEGFFDLDKARAALNPKVG